MADYISPPIEVEPDDYTDIAYDVLQTEWPNWEANEANLEVAILEGVGQIAAELAILASDVPASIFRWFGANLLGFPPGEAAAAGASSTWTMIDNAGYTIPIDTQVGIRTSGDDLYMFQTVDEVIIPPGSTTTAPGQVVIEAMDEGADYSGLGAVGTVLEVIDPLDFVASAVLTGPTSGGADEQDDDDYLNSLSERLQLLTPRPILPNDFAVLAKDLPGIDRALVKDTTDPTLALVGGLWNNSVERAVTVVALDELGAGIGSTLKTELETLLQGLRELNFNVFVADPTVTTIDVTFSIKTFSGYVNSEVLAAAESAVEEYLSPANWGQPPNSETREWQERRDIRTNDIVAAVDVIEGVDYVTSVNIEGTGVGLIYTLPGPGAHLPTPGVITGTLL